MQPATWLPTSTARPCELPPPDSRAARSEAAVTIRSALQTINRRLAKKLPANVLDATTTVSQSGTVDLLFRTSRWIEDLYIPLFLLGVAIVIVSIVKARDRVRAIRTA